MQRENSVANVGKVFGVVRSFAIRFCLVLTFSVFASWFGFLSDDRSGDGAWSKSAMGKVGNGRERKKN